MKRRGAVSLVWRFIQDWLGDYRLVAESCLVLYCIVALGQCSVA